MRVFPEHWGAVGLGRFSLRVDMIHGLDFDELVLLFRDVVIVRSNYDEILDEMKYNAVSRHFRPLESGDLVPEYRVTIAFQGDTMAVEWIEIGAHG